ncbi:MAG: hypothetical protein AAF633_13865 [Chloroflexota bacterium]
MNKKTPFAAQVQLYLVILMLGSILLISQSWTLNLYRAGLILMGITALSQIAFGNIQPSAGMARSMRQYAVYMAIIVAIFAASILITPTLVSLGR